MSARAKAPGDNDYTRIARLARIMGCKRRTVKHLRSMWRLQRAGRPVLQAEGSLDERYNVRQDDPHN
jgi:hypothetical protein